MRILFFLVLLIGLGMASFAGFLVLQRFEAYNAQIVKLRKEVGEKIELGEVAIAVGDLSYGASLAKENIKFVKWPISAIPEEAFTSEEDLFGKPEDEQPSRTVLRAIDMGKIISNRTVTGFGQDAGVASRLERGMRAFTLKVDVASGVSGFLRPVQ